jgi:hypothetical protein
MAFQFAGSIGIGLVWGWLVGTLEGRVQRSLRGIVGAIVSTIAVAITIYGFESWSGLALFFLSAGIALLTQLAWRRSLRSRVDTPAP